MKENYICLLLDSFSKSELKEFDRFLRSPYFMEGRNLRSNLIYKYFCLLKESFPGFSKSNINKKDLFGKLYDGREFSSVLLRRLDSDLGKLAIEFLNQEEFRKDAALQSINSASAISKRLSEKLIRKQLAKSEKILSSQKYDSDYNYNMQSLVLIKNNYAYTKDDMLKIYDIRSEADNFMKYTFCRGLEIFRNIQNDKAILNLKIDTHFFENLLTFLEANKQIIDNDDYIAMHYFEIMLNLKKEDKYYFELKDLKNRISENLKSSTLRNLYITMVNYCIRKTNLGFAGFKAERYELDKEIMEHDIHNTEEYFDMNYFLSTVRNAVSLGEHQWSIKFIETYKAKLEPRHKEFSVNYALGVLSYGKRDFGKALEYLSKINIEYSARKQQVKDLMIVIYCETEVFESALNLIETSIHSLRLDKQIPEERKKTFSKFLDFVRKYIKLKLKPDEFNMKSLKQKITKSDHFVNKDWLLEKVEELRKPTKD